MPNDKPKIKYAHAFYNWGRWLVECPDCHVANYVERGTPKFICLSCNAGLDAVAKQPFTVETVHAGKQTYWRDVPDWELREAAEAKAVAAGRQYLIAWPAEAEEIENILRPIDDNNFRSWYPATLFGLHGRAKVSRYGETVEELRAFAAKQIEKQKAGA